MERDDSTKILSPKTPQPKKMKQTLLPFQILGPSPKETKKIIIDEPRKRKPSPINETNDRVAKIGRVSEGKENVIEETTVSPNDNIIDVDIEIESQVNDPLKPEQKSAKKMTTPKTQRKTKDKVTDKEDKLIIKLAFPKKTNNKNSTTVKDEEIEMISMNTNEENRSNLKEESVKNKLNVTHDVESVPEENLHNDEKDKKSSETPVTKQLPEPLIELSDGICDECNVSEELKTSDDVINISLISDEDNSSEGNNVPSIEEPLKADDIIQKISLISNEDSDSESNDISRAEECCTPDSSFIEVSDGSKGLKKNPRLRKKKLDTELRDKQRRLAKEDRERKLIEEKELRQKERDDKEKQRKKEREDKEEQKRKEREEKEELRKKEKEEKEKKRLAEIEQKNEEKRIKEEEKRKREEIKEEEKRKKEEERKKKDIEVETKNKKAAEAFTKFFVQKKSDTKLSEDENSSENFENSTQNLNFMPFRVKGNMRLAPIVRRKLSADQRKLLKGYLEGENEIQPFVSYLKEIRNINLCGRSARTWPIDDGDEEIVLIVDNADAGQEIEEFKNKKQRYRAKFFKFHENRRPPYYGTWRKKSTDVNPRNPFATDRIFDYEVDSDDEWEEEEPGESLHGSDDDGDKESEDDYEVDNEFFVPHGHLSDEEMQQEDEVLEDNSPEAQKVKLKILQQEFAAEMKKKTEKIKPCLFGCHWDNGSKKQLGCSPVVFDLFQSRGMLFDDPIVFVYKDASTDNASLMSSPKTDSANAIKKIKMTDDGIKDLIRLIHGNPWNKKFLSKEYQAYRMKEFGNTEGYIEFWNSSVLNKIKEIALWKQYPHEGPMYNKLCWCVSPDTLEKYDLLNLKVPNEWSYVLNIKSKRNKDTKNDSIVSTAETEEIPAEAENIKSLIDLTPIPQEPDDTPDVSKSDINANSETKSVKKLYFGLSSESETKKNNLSENTSKKISLKRKSTDDISSAPKKRVQFLMSVPRGETIPQVKKNMLIKQFLKKTTDTSVSPSVAASNANPNDNTTELKSEDVVVID